MLKKLKDKGLVEFVYQINMIISTKVVSIVRILFLRLRNYNLEYSVILGKNVIIFQSVKNSISIGKNSFIGDGARLKAGFEGKILIGNNVYIHDYTFIFAHETLRIGDNTLISPNVFITDFNHKIPHEKYSHLLSDKKGYTSKPVTIGKNVWVGSHVVILPGVSVGDGAVVGAGSIVTKSVPPNSIVVGNPARVVKKITED